MRAPSLRTLTLFILAVGFGTLENVPVHADERIKIGVSTALTGEAATYGVDIRNSLIFAADTIAPGKYELVFQDDKCSGREAVNAAHYLAEVADVKYVLGVACSGAMLSSAKVYEQAKIVVISSSASAAAISQAGDYIFRTWSTDAAASQQLYELVRKKHKRLGIISEQSEYSQGFRASFKKLNAERSVEIFNEDFIASTTDFRSILLRLRIKGVEALFLNTQTEQTLYNIVKQIRELKIDLPLYNVYFGGSPTFLEKAGAQAEGIVYLDLPHISEVLDAKGQALYADFVARFGKMKSVELVFASTYDSFLALHLAITSGQDVRDYLYQNKINGLMGAWHFDTNGDIQGLDFVNYIVKDGRGQRLK